MTTPSELQIKASQSSITSLTKLATEIQSARQDAKVLSDLLKGLKVRQIEGLGLKGNVDVKAQREYLSLINASVKSLQNEKALRLANSRNLKVKRKTIGQINSLERAQLGLEAAKLRLGKAALSQDQQKVTRNKNIVRLYEKRVQALQQEKRLAEQTARAEQRRQTSLSRFRNPDREMMQAQTGFSRQMNIERLFGDNGAALFQVQAGLAANYMLMNGVRTLGREAARFTVELDREIRNLQAIVALTDGSLEKLRDRLVDVSEVTKFTAVEVAKAAVTLGQAGLSVQEIESAIEPITLLATATGSTLPQAVDTATSILGVFNMEGARMAEVANTITQAINDSKLNMEKLTLGLQYAGNTAAQIGVTFNELTASLGAMANAGIRSGSTLGTGTRQILIALQNPSNAFIETITKLGLTMDDLSLRTQGLYGVMKTLKDAGFTAADAFETFEVRAGAAFSALSNNLDVMLDLQGSFLESTAAAAANEAQMRSFGNQLDRLGSAAGSVAVAGLTPMVNGLTLMMSKLSDVLSALKEWEGTLAVATTGLTALAAGFAIGWVINLFTTLITRAWGALAGLTTQATAASGAMALLRGAFTLSAGAIGGMVTALAIIGVSIYAAVRNNRRLRESMNRLRTSYEESTGASEAFSSKLVSVNEKIEELQDRYNLLTRDQDALSVMIREVTAEFSEMGIEGAHTATSVDELIESLEQLRTELSEEYLIRLRMQQVDNTNMQVGLEDQLASQVSGTREDTNRLLSGRYSINADGEVIQSGNPVGPGPNLPRNPLDRQVGQEISSIDLRDRDQVQTLLNDFYARSQGLTDPGGTQREEAEAFNWAMDQLREILDIMNQQQQLEREERGNREEQESVAGRQTVQFQRIETNLASLSRDIETARNVAEEAPTAQEALRDWRAGAQPIEEELDRMVTAANNLLNLNLITPDVLNEILQEVEQQRARLNELNETFGDPAQAERAIDRQNELDQIEARIGSFDSDIEGLDRRAAQQIYQQRQRDVARQAQLLEERLQAEGELNPAQIQRATTQALIDGGRALSEEWFNYIQAGIDQQEDVNRSMRDMIIDELQSEFDNRIEQLEDPETSATDRGAAFAAAEQTARDIMGVMNRRDLMGVTNQNEIDLIRAQNQAWLDQVLEEIEEARTVGTSAQDEAERVERNAQDQFRIQQIDAELQRASTELESENLTSERIDTLEATVNQLLAERNQLELDVLNRTPNQPSTAVDSLALEQTGEQEAWDEQIENARELTEGLTALRNAVQSFQGVEVPQVMSPEEAVEQYGDLAEAMLDVQEAQQDLGELEAQEGLENVLGVAQGLVDQMGLSTENAAYLRAELERIGTLNSFSEQATALSGLMTWISETTSRMQTLGTVARAVFALLGITAGKTGETATTVNPPPSNSSGRGNDRDEVLEWVDNIQAQLEALALDIDDAGASFETRSAAAERIFQRAEERLSEVNSELAALQSRLANGTLTSSEQERLNTLVERHQALTELIRENDEEILRLRGQQAISTQMLTQTVGDWSQENLNLVDTFEGGIINALGNMKSALTEFFTSWTSGTKSGKEAFRDLASSVIQSLQNIFAEMLVVWALQRIMGLIFPGANIPQQSFAGIAGNMFGGGRKEGGEIKVRRAAAGERVKGNLNRDSELYELMDGEFVLRRSAAQAIGYENLQQMNAMGNRTFASTGHQGSATKGGQSAKPGTMNLYLVDERSKAGNLGPSDILAVVNDDINRGGSTKRLIKAVQVGAV